MTLTSLTWVPFDDPRSSTKKRPFSMRIMECLRDTIASSVRTAQSSARPTYSGAVGVRSTCPSRPWLSRKRTRAPMAVRPCSGPLYSTRNTISVLPTRMMSPDTSIFLPIRWPLT